MLLVFYYTYTEDFIRNTCTPTHLCKYLINQSYGGGAMYKIIRIRASSFSQCLHQPWNRGKWDLGDCNHGMVIATRWAGLSISDFLVFFLGAYSKHANKEKYPVNGSSADWNSLLREKRQTENGHAALSWQITTMWNCSKQKSISEC